MSKFPLYLSFKETNKYFDSLKSIDDKIEYYRYIVDVYEEMYRHKSLKDVESYIDKFKFKGKLKNIKAENPIESSDIVFADEQKNDIYSNTKYQNLHNKLNLLWTSYSNDLDRLLYYHSVTQGDFKLVFTDDDFEKVFASFNTKDEQLKWVSELSQKTYGIWKHFGDRHMALLYKKYNLLKFYALTEINEPIHKRSFITKKYDVFRKYLIGPLSYKLSALEHELEIDIKVELVLSYENLNSVPEKDKFFLWGFKYDTMLEFADKAFLSLGSIIEYYSYALLMFYTEHFDFLDDKYMNTQFKSIEYRLNYLKAKYEVRKYSDKILDSNSDNESTIELSKKIIGKPCFPVIKNKNKPIWLKGEQKLLVLLQKLQFKGYIEDKLDTSDWKEKYLALFINHATKKPFSNFEVTPILWKEEVIDLACLIHELNQGGFKPCLDNYHRSKRISSIFLYETRNNNKNNNERKIDYVNSSTLTSEISNVKNNKISKWEIAEIAHSVRQYSV